MNFIQLERLIIALFMKRQSFRMQFGERVWEVEFR